MILHDDNASPPRVAAACVAQLLFTIIFTNTIMFQGYKDASPHMYRVVNFGQFVNWLRKSLVWSGSSTLASLSIIFYAAYVLSVVIGLPLTIFRLDRDKTADQLQGGYVCLLGIAMAFMVSFVLDLASGSGPALLNSMILSILQGLVLSVVRPAAKRMCVASK